MYRLEIYYPNDDAPKAVRYVDRAADTLTLISELLQEHGGCQRIVVWSGPTRLFAVDCKGNRVSD